MHWPQRPLFGRFSSFRCRVYASVNIMSSQLVSLFIRSDTSLSCVFSLTYIFTHSIFSKRPYVRISPSTGNWVPHLCCVLLTSLNSHERERPPESARLLSEGSWIKLIHRGMGYRNYGTVIKHFCLNVASCQVQCLIIQAGIPKISWQLQRASACVCKRASRRRCCGVIVTGDAL